MKKNYIEAALMTLTVLAGIFAIFMAVWYLVGNSPTSGELNAGFIVLIASWLIILTFKFGSFEGMTKSSFHYAKRDMKDVKEELREIKEILLKRKR